MSPRSSHVPPAIRLPRAGRGPAAPVLVLGAGGGVGRGIVEALLQADQPVIALGREGASLRALGELLGDDPRVSLLPLALDSDDAGAGLAQALRRLGRPLRAVVACLAGPFASGRLLATPVDRARSQLDADLVPHLIAARHLLPLLAERSKPSRYVVIGGPCADNVWAGYGQTSISAAALRMFVRGLHEETAGGPVRVQQLSVATPVATWRNTACAGAEWPRAVEVGRRLLALLDSTDARAIVPFDPRHADGCYEFIDCRNGITP